MPRAGHEDRELSHSSAGGRSGTEPARKPSGVGSMCHRPNSHTAHSRSLMSPAKETAEKSSSGIPVTSGAQGACAHAVGHTQVGARRQRGGRSESKGRPRPHGQTTLDLNTGSTPRKITSWHSGSLEACMYVRG